MTILIADDNPINLKLLRVVLEAEGHQVLLAENGIQALDFLREEKVDLVISDILMPKMDGYRLCQTIRASEGLKHIPFIFYTATYTSPSDEGLALKVGADRYIRKPASTAILLANVDEVVSSPRPSEAVSDPGDENHVVMKEYNEALIRKLEHKNAELVRAQLAISKTNEELEQRVRERTAELQVANEELEAFGHSAAHDLRTPLRAINGYCRILLEDYGDRLGVQGKEYLDRIGSSTRRMNDLIEELLKLSHIGRCALRHDLIDVSDLVTSIIEEMRRHNPDQNPEAVVKPGIVAQGDGPLLRIALENLISNAWKFSGKSASPRIEFDGQVDEGRTFCFIRDNGAGFNMEHADKLFSAFHRMHSAAEFAGSGLGLTIVHRIVTRHGGNVWAEGIEGEGATFFMTLPN